jgi:hypothetical protein
LPAKKEEEVKQVLVVDPASMIARTDVERDILMVAAYLPYVSVNVDRKINMGNYESLGLGIRINMPVGLTPEQRSTYEGMAAESITAAFTFASKEMNDRVIKVRKKQRGEDTGE